MPTHTRKARHRFRGIKDKDNGKLKEKDDDAKLKKDDANPNIVKKHKANILNLNAEEFSALKADVQMLRDKYNTGAPVAHYDEVITRIQNLITR